MELEVYAWQKDCLKTWIKNDCRGIVQAVTGAGKTHLALDCIQYLEQDPQHTLRVKIVVPGSALLRQWKNALAARLPDGAASQEIGVFGGGRKDDFCRKYMIYVINSARYHLARQILEELKKGYTVLMVADECHHYASGENQKIFEFLPFVEGQPGAYCSLGLSATPQVPGYDDVLLPGLGKEIYRYGISQALRRGTVCEFAIWQIALSFDVEEQEEYEELTEEMKYLRAQLFRVCPGLKYCNGAQFFGQLRMLALEGKGKTAKLASSYMNLSYKRKRMVCMAKARVDCTCQLLRQMEAEKHILIFGESIQQAEQLYERLCQIYPGRVGRYHSRMGATANRNVLERFRNGDLRILITCRALDEGVDVPDAAVGIILSGTSMERQRLQRLGRILRRSQGKRMACLYYLFVADSREENAYFPKRTEAFAAENLYYDSEMGEFSYPAYEKAADQVTQEFLAQGAQSEFCEEALTCIQLGMLRPDWLMKEEACRERAERAGTTRERNYWICMGKMAGTRKDYEG